jgi:hypothetical protein
MAAGPRSACRWSTCTHAPASTAIVAPGKGREVAARFRGAAAPKSGQLDAPDSSAAPAQSGALARRGARRRVPRPKVDALLRADIRQLVGTSSCSI